MESDFNLLGQRYTTSKCVDLSTLKAAANTYGYQGLSLANIVNISRNVKITSRYENNEDTWLKIFYKGKTKELTKTSVRPSKGTTVEVKGFLYNLHIQSKSVHTLNELNEIKTFMQQFSLIHCNVSLSLRDDAKNEIIFQAHKNRDMCQSIQLLFNIDPQDIQQFRVEKNQYKVTAFIGKKYEDGHTHWIYLNGKFLSNSTLHKIINDNLKKSWKTSKNVKTKKTENEDLYLLKNKIPFYVILLSCPYYDYHISNTPKHTILEFKSWDEITKLLEKLIKFYTGDNNFVKQLKPLKKIEKNKVDDTREQVRKIVERLLKNNPKIGVSQMNNGVKGKLIKRKIKKKLPNISLSKVIPPKTVPAIIPHKISENLEYSNESHDSNMHAGNKVEKDFNVPKKKSKRRKRLKSKIGLNKVSNKMDFNSKMNDKIPANKELDSDIFLPTINSIKSEEKYINKKCFKNIPLNKKLNSIETCDMVDISMQHSPSCVSISEMTKSRNKLSNDVTDQINVSAWKKIDETIIHDYLPHPLKCTQLSHINHNLNQESKNNQNHISSHNLLKTVLNTQICNISNIPKYNSPHTPRLADQPWNFKLKASIKSSNCTHNGIFLSKFTYESHNYNKHSMPRSIHTSEKKRSKCQFITINSMEKFLNYKETYSSISKKKNYKKQRKIKGKFNNVKEQIATWKKNNNRNDLQKLSYGIEFSKYNSSLLCDDFIHEYRTKRTSSFVGDLRKNKSIDLFSDKENYISNSVNANIGHTYTILSKCSVTETQKVLIENCDLSKDTYNCNDKKNKNYKTDFNKFYNNKSSNSDIYKTNVIISTNIESITSIKNIEPVNVCEAIISNNSDDVVEKEYELNSEYNKLHNTLSNGQSKNNTISHAHEINDLIVGEISHHFRSFPESDYKETENPIRINTLNEDQSKYGYINQEFNNLHHKNIGDALDKDVNNFNIQTRYNFVPKGLSPIFQNCYTNNACSYNLEKDYFEENVYHNFINDVYINCEVFKPILLNISDINTADIERVNTKLHKENSSITFDAIALKSAKVLGQVDCKFIAAIMKASDKSTDYLVLFDQHAVHERIRLETNLSDYFNGFEWKSVKLDDILVKLSEDELLYVHNYKDKFTSFGLAYTIFNKYEISINAIPEAILGKNSRSVEKVIAAVKNLILEEINTIKSQKGCISMYPKSIMDLVFSEACRYAVKFGDKLSKDDCSSFLQSLSECKTPFQCAHGRPVMAVLTNIQYTKNDYKVIRHIFLYTIFLHSLTLVDTCLCILSMDLFSTYNIIIYYVLIKFLVETVY
ncbi:putative uncharacterized protein DDB_G0282133 isoform X3 [Galleria mellonella]|nr:putative uncharacterized protein DDB_G0282133 isoform X3 [Galleria mellonella]